MWVVFYAAMGLWAFWDPSFVAKLTIKQELAWLTFLLLIELAQLRATINKGRNELT